MTYLKITTFFIFSIHLLGTSFMLASSKTLSTTNGLHSIGFQTPHGKIYLYLTDDISFKDNFSGKLITEPVGQNEKKIRKNARHLNRYSIEMAGQRINVAKKWMKGVIPAEKNMVIKLRNPKGKVVDSIQIPVDPEPKIPETDEFQCPKITSAGHLFQIKGKLDGDLLNTIVQVDEKALDKWAESPRKAILESPKDIIGNMVINFRDGNSKGSCLCRNISIHTQVGKLKLKTGEITDLTVMVEGLDDMSNLLPLHIQNKTPDIVVLKGKDTIIIHPDEVESGGTFVYKTSLKGIRPGQFSIDFTIYDDPPPIITEIIPTSGFSDSSIDLIVSGQNFKEESIVSFHPEVGIQIASSHLLSPSTLMLIVHIDPHAPISSRDIEIRNPDGGNDRWQWAFHIADHDINLKLKIVEEGEIKVPENLPDTDGDDVPDYRDRNPKVKGLPKYNGDTEDREEMKPDPKSAPGPRVPEDWSKEARKIVYYEREVGLLKPGDVVTYRVEEGGTEWMMAGWTQILPWSMIKPPYASTKAHGWASGTVWLADFRRALNIKCIRYRTYRLIKIVNGKEVSRSPYFKRLKEVRFVVVHEEKTVQVGHGLGDAPSEVPPDVPLVPYKKDEIYWWEFAEWNGDPLPPQKDFSGVCKEIKD